MKRYLFGLHYHEIYYHEEMFACDADAMMRAREILEEGKRDLSAFLISVYSLTKSGDWKLIVSYQ